MHFSHVGAPEGGYDLRWLGFTAPWRMQLTVLALVLWPEASEQ